MGLKEGLKKIYSRICPINNAVRYEGAFPDWRTAEMRCTGYAANEIFEKVKEAAILVRDGKACYERDSVLFYRKDYNYPLLAYLNGAANRCGSELYVIDWGGSLGSTYFQNRGFLCRNIKKYKWTIIEQSHFVEFGQKELQSGTLEFCNDIESVESIYKYQCILFSGVLQYLNFAEGLLKQVAGLGIENIIVERTPVGKKEMILVEQIREPIYNASYPLRVFEEKSFVGFFENNGYELIDSWESTVDCKIRVEKEEILFMSFVFRKK